MPPKSAAQQPDRSDLSELSESARELIRKVGSRVKQSDVDNAIALKGAEDRSRTLIAFVDAWEDQQREERQLRKTYARVLICILSVELAAIFVAFFLLGLGVISLDRWAAQVFLVTSLVQTASLVAIIVRYLFPNRASDLVSAITSHQRTPTQRTRGRMSRGST